MSRSSIGQLAIVTACLVTVMQQVLAQTTFDPTTASFDQIHARIAQMQSAGDARQSTQELVEQWIQAIGIDKLTVEKARWCLEQSLPQKADRKEFTALWTGTLMPPRTGQYVFSVSPININKKGPPDEVVRHTIKVWVDGQQIIDASPQNWNWQGTPIQLQASQSVSLRVELIYYSSDGTYGDSPHALLFGEGPGIARHIVPTEVLSPPDGEGRGLRAEYRWMDAGQEYLVVQRDPNIEFAWATCRDVAPRNPELITALTERLWQLATEPAYLASQVAEQPPAHAHPYFRNYTSLQFLSMSQRRQFIHLLLQDPRLLDRADQKQILRLYHSLRFADEKAALDVLGLWMQQHTDSTPEIAQDYFDANMRFYRNVALYLAFRAPNSEHYQSLQDKYLETIDGRCCLPVAYSLAYYHFLMGKLDVWLKRIDEKLKDESIVGEKRVNWILARAQAQEIRYGGSYRFEIPRVDPLAGTNWLTEAHLVAENDATHVRVYREEIARLAAANSERRAQELLTALVGRIPAAELQDWQTKTEAVLKAWGDRQKEDEQVARDMYVDVLIQRKEEAAAQNDQEAVARYDMLLERTAIEAK